MGKAESDARSKEEVDGGIEEAVLLQEEAKPEAKEEAEEEKKEGEKHTEAEEASDKEKEAKPEVAKAGEDTANAEEEVKLKASETIGGKKRRKKQSQISKAQEAAR